MKKLLLLAALGLFLAGGCKNETVQEKSGSERIGMYDSRSVAVAFVGSRVYEKTDGLVMKQWMEEYKKAKSENDNKKITELKEKGEARQEKLHMQGFGTGSVDEILAYIPEQISEIKKKHNVKDMVSKWDLKKIEGYKSAEKIDVTMDLIEAFGPTERQSERAIGIQKFKPIANEKLKGKID